MNYVKGRVHERRRQEHMKHSVWERALHSFIRAFQPQSYRRLGTRELKASSISDTENYRKACQAAAEDPQVFANFRRLGVIREVIETVGKREANEIMKSLGDSEHRFSHALTESIRCDTIGNPYRSRIGTLGRVPPTTVRYATVYSTLQLLCGSFRELSVGEIGVGYGGLERLFLTTDPPRQISVFDLPEVTALTDQFLQANGLNTDSVTFQSVPTDCQDLDLVISNFAFSELRRDLQDNYLQKVLLRSRAGFVIINSIASDDFQSI